MKAISSGGALWSYRSEEEYRYINVEAVMNGGPEACWKIRDLGCGAMEL